MNVIDIIVSIVIHLFFRIVEPLKIGKEENLHVFNYTFPRNKVINTICYRAQKNTQKTGMFAQI